MSESTKHHHHCHLMIIIIIALIATQSLPPQISLWMRGRAGSGRVLRGGKLAIIIITIIIVTIIMFIITNPLT